jgi:archaellum biogenesis protein FlaJ (TadC family)
MMASEGGMKKFMPYALVSILISIAVVAVLYAKIYPAGGNVLSGMYLGALMGIFAVCVFVIHNYVYLNIGATLALYEAVTYLIQWVIVGAAIGLIYKP